jgi:hypothetical protein
LLAGGRPPPDHTTGGRIGSKIDQTESGSRRANEDSRMTTPSETTRIVRESEHALKRFFR